MKLITAKPVAATYYEHIQDITRYYEWGRYVDINELKK